MTQPEPSTPYSAMGYDEVLVQLRRLHTAEANAAYLLPQLRRGLRLLDFGCGLGSISAGLAKAIAPGELHGVDVDEGQIELARSLADSAGISNAVFHVGDLTALPFPEDFFDVAHCHNVLIGVPDTQAVLTEVKRTLKPGGIIACREMISGSGFFYPDMAGVLRTAWDVFEDLLSLDGGHPQAGKDLKTGLLEAGFTNPRVSASFDSYSSPADVAFIHFLAKQWFLSPDMREGLSVYDLSPDRLLDRVNAGLDEWKNSPDAAIAFAYGDAVAGKP